MDRSNCKPFAPGWPAGALAVMAAFAVGCNITLAQTGERPDRTLGAAANAAPAAASGNETSAPATTSEGALTPPRRRWEPPPPPPPATEQDLRHEELAKRRASERWAAIREGRFDQAYEYLSPAGRLVVSRERHIQILKGLPVLNAEVTHALCRGGKCQVTVLQTVEMTVPRVGKRQHRSAAFEQWIVDGDQVWLLVRAD